MVVVDFDHWCYFGPCFVSTSAPPPSAEVVDMLGRRDKILEGREGGFCFLGLSLVLPWFVLSIGMRGLLLTNRYRSQERETCHVSDGGGGAGGDDE